MPGGDGRALRARRLLRAPAGPPSHFLTSAHLTAVRPRRSPLITLVDDQLGQPDPLDVVDIGAGRRRIAANLKPLLPSRRPAAAGRDSGDTSPGRNRPGCCWPPNGSTTCRSTWLATGTTSIDGEPVGAPEDAAWIATLVAGRRPGIVEIGLTRDEAWAQAVGHLDRGLALAVDYGHFLGTRPSSRNPGRFPRRARSRAAPGRHHDLTCHVAIDSAAAATGLRPSAS